MISEPPHGSFAGNGPFHISPAEGILFLLDDPSVKEITRNGLKIAPWKKNPTAEPSAAGFRQIAAGGGRYLRQPVIGHCSLAVARSSGHTDTYSLPCNWMRYVADSVF